MVDTEDTRRTTDNATGMAYKLLTGELKTMGGGRHNNITIRNGFKSKYCV